MTQWDSFSIYCDYLIFQIGIRHRPSFYDRKTKCYDGIYDGYYSGLLKHKTIDNISYSVPDIELHFLMENEPIVPFDEFIASTHESYHSINGWKSNLWRISDRHQWIDKSKYL